MAAEGRTPEWPYRPKTILPWNTIDTGFGTTCSAEGCSRPYYIKGLCKLHHDIKTYREETKNARAHNPMR